jgi:hypothetical protein
MISNKVLVYLMGGVQSINKMYLYMHRKDPRKYYEFYYDKVRELENYNNIYLLQTAFINFFLNANNKLDTVLQDENLENRLILQILVKPYLESDKNFNYKALLRRVNPKAMKESLQKIETIFKQL